mmetsp:Transcript_36626/g.42568  ORF Transcript_36626/g.42568 Transcript_36626/m.42568 type:complete len:267 (-) Transcript_36626:122-922(-)
MTVMKNITNEISPNPWMMHDQDVVMTIATMHSCARVSEKENRINATHKEKPDIIRSDHSQFSSLKTSCKPRKQDTISRCVRKSTKITMPRNTRKRKLVCKRDKQKYTASERNLTKTEIIGDSSQDFQTDTVSQNHAQSQPKESTFSLPYGGSCQDREVLCKKIEFLYDQSRRRRKFHLELFTKNLSNRAYNNKKHDAQLNRKDLPMFQDNIYDLCKVNLTPLSVFARRQYIVRAFRAKFNLQCSTHRRIRCMQHENNLRIMPQEVN